MMISLMPLCFMSYQVGAFPLPFFAAVEYELQVHTQRSENAGSLISMSVEIGPIHTIGPSFQSAMGSRIMLTGFAQSAREFAPGNTAVFQFMANKASLSDDQPLEFDMQPNPRLGASEIVVGWAKLTNRDTGEWQMYKTPGVLANDRWVTWSKPKTTLEVPPADTSADSKCHC
jgi:hypothetical protein